MLLGSTPGRTGANAAAIAALDGVPPEPVQDGVRDLGPPAVDRERMAAVGELDQVRDREGPSVALGGGAADRGGDRAIATPRPGPQRTAGPPRVPPPRG